MFDDKYGVLTFIITMPKADFTSILVTRTYKRRDKGRPPSTRKYTIYCNPEHGSMYLAKKFGESAKLSCGFNFKRHKLNCDAESGYANVRANADQ